jgi:hypothetical protein
VEPSLLLRNDPKTCNPVTVRTYPGDYVASDPSTWATFTGRSGLPSNCINLSVVGGCASQALNLLDDSGIRFRNIRISTPYESGFKLSGSHNLEFDHVIVDRVGSGCPASTSWLNCTGVGLGGGTTADASANLPAGYRY